MIAMTSPPTTSATTGSEEARRHILVVDDDARLRRLLQRYLTEHGHRVSTAPNVPEAKAALKNFAFDLMILDVMMPGQDGVSFTAELRARMDLPVLLLTARGEIEDRVNGLAVGADDYLVKPFDPRELLLRIATILRRAAPATPERWPLRLTEQGAALEERLNGGLRRRLALAYRAAGADAVAGYHQVLLGLVDERARRHIMSAG